MSLTEDAKQLHGDLVRLRRELHAAPEVGLHLPRTQERVLAALDGLPLEVGTGTALTSVTAVLRGGRPGPTVLLRGDMDALPVANVPTSTTPRRFPATCTRAGTTCTPRCSSAPPTCCRRGASTSRATSVFMFQPGEEGYDGAGHMLAEGVLEASGSRPVAAYGLHVSASGAPGGVFVTRKAR